MPTAPMRDHHSPRDADRILAQRLEAGVLLLDGATGTELERFGVDCSLPLWSARAMLEAPNVLEQIHREYVEAGVDCITANTFRTQPHVLRHAGLEARAPHLSARAIEIARAAASARPDVLIAGSAAPLEDCYRPERVPAIETLEREHAKHCGALAAGGADFILIETIGTVRELRVVSQAAAATGLPFLVSLIGGPAGATLLSGEPVEAAVEAISKDPPVALLINCVPPSQLDQWWPALAKTRLPFGVYPNLGTPGTPPGAARSEDLSPDAFACRALRWVEQGARVIGGCCGTRPAHIRAAIRAVKKLS